MKKILVIEDENDIRNDLCKALQLSGYESYAAENGYVGVEIAHKVKPQLILSDIMMPGIDGYEVFDKLQSNPDTATIPFIFLSAKSAKIDVRNGMNIGADDYITKPFDFDELLTVVERRLNKSNAAAEQYNRKYEALSASLRSAMPHEIRTPLNIILGLSEFLRKNLESTPPKEVQEMLGNINDAGKRLQRLFENYLFYANLELLGTNRTELDAMKTKKTALAEYLIKDIAGYTAGNMGRYQDLEADLQDATVYIAENYFTKIIEEILDNCYKFSDRGSAIKIVSFRERFYYVLQFTDYGRGMSVEQINRIGAYVQFERKMYEQQGSGLGLSIVKKLTELHGGEFYIDSEPGDFTTITIKLPAEFTS